MKPYDFKLTAEWRICPDFRFQGGLVFALGDTVIARIWPSEKEQRWVAATGPKVPVSFHDTRDQAIQYVNDALVLGVYYGE